MFGSTWVSSPTLHVLTMTAQECYDRLLQDQEQIAHLANVVHNSVRPYRILSQLPHGWLNTISHYCLAFQVIHLLCLSFIGSPVPIPATHTQTMDTKCPGFRHC